MRILIVALCCALTSCAWLPIARIPEGKEGAIVVKCRSYKGLIRRDSRWLIVVWVWSKSGTLPDSPGTFTVDGDCTWRVEREPGPQVTIRPLLPGSADQARFKPHEEPLPK